MICLTELRLFITRLTSFIQTALFAVSCCLTLLCLVILTSSCCFTSVTNFLCLEYCDNKEWINIYKRNRLYSAFIYKTKCRQSESVMQKVNSNSMYNSNKQCDGFEWWNSLKTNKRATQTAVIIDVMKSLGKIASKILPVLCLDLWPWHSVKVIIT